MLKRLLSVMLTLSLVMSVLASCSENGNEAADPGAKDPAQPNNSESAVVNEETEPDYQDDLPEVTYDGSDFVIYSSNATTNTWFTTNFVDFEEDSADVLESAIYRRNRLVEERFDINISEIYMEIDGVKTAIMGGDDTSDLNLHTGSQAFGLIQEGYIYDQLKLNLDFDKPFWDTNAVRELTIAGKLFISAGDFMTTHYDISRGLFFNKGLAENYHLDNPYELVKNNKWTYDTFNNMLSQVGGDVDGNGIYNDMDVYGVLSYTELLTTYLLLASGEKFVSKDENDMPYLSFYNERFVQAYEKVFNILYGEGGYHYFDANTGNTRGVENHRVQEIMFPNNQSLFWVEALSWSKALRDMEFDFGILPAPKLDESQDRYYHVTSGGFYGSVIPTTVKDVEKTCTILTALNSMSTGMIDVAYYDVMLKSKISRDEESSEMIDIIINNIIYDTSLAFGFATVKSDIANLMSGGSTDIASYYNRSVKVQSKLMNKAFEKIVTFEH